MNGVSMLRTRTVFSVFDELRFTLEQHYLVLTLKHCRVLTLEHNPALEQHCLGDSYLFMGYA